MALDNDAYSRALMMAGLGMMGQPNVWQALSRGGMFGMQAYDQALNQKDKRAEEAQQRQMRQMQINQATQAYGDQQAERALASRAFAPGVSPLTPNDDNGNPICSTRRASIRWSARAWAWKVRACKLEQDKFDRGEFSTDFPTAERQYRRGLRHAGSAIHAGARARAKRTTSRPRFARRSRPTT
jgi:hypothetical protein